MCYNNQKQIIIIHDNETAIYANYLRQLISCDGCFSAIVWTEKEYADNRPTVSSDEYLLFIGNHKAAKAERSTMEIKYSGYGGQYSWLGKRGCLSVTKGIGNEKTYRKFIEECNTYKKISVQKNTALSKVIKISSDVIKADTSRQVFAASPQAATIALILSAAILGTAKLKEKKIIRDQQYRFLIVKFFTDDLEKFLEAQS